MNKHGLTPLRFKKLKELLHSHYGRWVTLNSAGEIHHGLNLYNYIFRPRTTSLLEFCMNDLTDSFKVSIKGTYTIDQIIDLAYSNFILGEYNMSSIGADFKFNTIRNVFKYNFKSRKYMINHYSHKLSLPIISILKKEFVDRDVINLFIPVKLKIMERVKEVENGIRDHVRREFALLRAGPYNIRSPLTLVA
jgi:hypothetical protein